MAEFLNNNIKHLRNIKGISQQELADKVGIDRSTISRIENNEIETTIDNAIKIAEALEVSINDLVSYDLRLKNIPQTDKDYKKILIDKGLMDENENINEEKIDDLLKIAEMMKKLNDKEKQQ